MSRHGVPPSGGYSMPRHRVPGGILCLGMVYPGVQGAGGSEVPLTPVQDN